MKIIAICILMISSIYSQAQLADKIVEVEKKVKSIEKISDVDALEIEISILNLLDDYDTWSFDLIEHIRSVTVLNDGTSSSIIRRIEGIHDCYYDDSIDDIINNKHVSNNHNPVLKILDLKKSGNEKEKVQRIIDELIRRGLRE
jgi:hypothetical protein